MMVDADLRRRSRASDRGPVAACASGRALRAGMLAIAGRSRGFILASVERDFRRATSAPALGFFWTVLQPLAHDRRLHGGLLRASCSRALPGADAVRLQHLPLRGHASPGRLFAEIAAARLRRVHRQREPAEEVELPALEPAADRRALSALSNFAIVVRAVPACSCCVIGRFPGWSRIARSSRCWLVALFAVGLGVLLGIAQRLLSRRRARLVRIAAAVLVLAHADRLPGHALPDRARDWLCAGIR